MDTAGKSGGSAIASTRGSSALTASVDIIVRLDHPDGTPPNLRVLGAQGRFDETPRRLALELTTSGIYELREGEIPTSRAAALVTSILALLPPAGRAGATINDLETATKAPRASVQEALDSLLAASKATKTDRGVRGDPFLYSLPA
ncbi:hypothetical protein AYO38_02905 [bacterium SCGC AG-212-C10]|nr:hypothetical protein AYO38_02905 [bacterium SCGC AG-212-C10]